MEELREKALEQVGACSLSGTPTDRSWCRLGQNSDKCWPCLRTHRLRARVDTNSTEGNKFDAAFEEKLGEDSA